MAEYTPCPFGASPIRCPLDDPMREDELPGWETCNWIGPNGCLWGRLARWPSRIVSRLVRLFLRR